MLLAIDIGNTSISCGVFSQGGELLHKFKLSSDINRTGDEYITMFYGMFFTFGINKDDFDGAVICSVVPMLTHKMCECAENITGKKPKIVGPGLKNGVSIKIDNPAELGADMVANSAAAIALMGDDVRDAIIVDMGTATTVSALNKKKEYLGNCILPGVKISLESLHGETAQIPSVAPMGVSRAIGKNSNESVRSGVILGNAIMINGFIDKFEKEMKIEKGSAKIFVTGGLAPVVFSHIERDFEYHESLTLFGLYCIYKNNVK